MNVQIDWFYLVSAAVIVVGLLEFVKGFFKDVKVPSWIWRAIIVPIGVGVAWAGDGGIYQVATNSLGLISLTAISYPVLIQIPAAIIQFFKDKIVGKV